VAGQAEDLELYSEKAFYGLMAGSFVGGLAGSLGLGGAVVFNPVLLSLGVPTTVTSATSMYLIMFSSASTTLIFITFKDLNIDYALIIGLSSALFIAVMMTFVAQWIRKTGRESVIVFILAAVVLASTVMTPLSGFKGIIEDHEPGTSLWALTSPCAPYVPV
jgi:uncharacterized membrane protein YfcA